MIRPSGHVCIHLYQQPIDMKKAIHGLVSIVEGGYADTFSFDLYFVPAVQVGLAFKSRRDRGSCFGAASGRTLPSSLNKLSGARLSAVTAPMS